MATRMTSGSSLMNTRMRIGKGVCDMHSYDDRCIRTSDIQKKKTHNGILVVAGVHVLFFPTHPHCRRCFCCWLHRTHPLAACAFVFVCIQPIRMAAGAFVLVCPKPIRMPACAVVFVCLQPILMAAGAFVLVCLTRHPGRRCFCLCFSNPSS